MMGAMRIAIVGTGQVARALGTAFATAGHDVIFGTRDPEQTRSRPEWSRAEPGGPSTGPGRMELVAYADLDGDVFVNATRGDASLAALQAVGPALDGKVVIDTSNALDFSQGMPPSLFVVNTDSLAEQLQRALPGARLVKMFNTMNNQVMADPASLGQESTIFLAGNDEAARQIAADLARDLGWTDVLDLGDLSAARGLEMYLPLWLRIMGAVGGLAFNIKVVR
jgi:8-hydroxy-5-deazaflavin:NADPH oxidoreductase